MRTLKEFTTWLNEEEAASPKFSIEQLKTIGVGDVSKENLVATHKYINRAFGPPKWEGSYRYAWPLENGTVLKVAKKINGIEQNENELRNSKCLGPEFSVQVIDYHPQFYWLVEEKVDELSEAEFVQEFNKKLGTSFQNRMEIDDDININTALLITDVIEDLVNGVKNKRYKKIYPLFTKSVWFDTTSEPTWFETLLSKLKGCNVSSNDFHHENWGIRPSTGEFVILDLGF
jgi:hypothetical protein